MKQIFTITGMTCGSCAMRIESSVSKISDVTSVQVDVSSRLMEVHAESDLDDVVVRNAVQSAGSYDIASGEAHEAEPTVHVTPSMKHSAWIWGMMGTVAITLVFYGIQTLLMKSWTTPFLFAQENWYFLLPLVLGFGIQLGFFRIIQLISRQKRTGSLVASGGVSSAGMVACCLHNLVPLFPILGVSGAATFFAIYQTEVFLISIGFVALGILYMIWNYKRIKDACHLIT